MQLKSFMKIEGEEYQGAKLITTSKGNLVYLAHIAFLKGSKIENGFIYIITGGRSYRTDRLNYVISLCREQPYLLIGDIQYDRINEGIGTELLKYIEEIARSQEVKIIKGWLSDIDLQDHRDRLLHFYSKNGFDITQGIMTGLNREGLVATKDI